MAKNIDSKAISTMKNSKLDLIQSISEQQQRTEQLQTSLQQLSQTLINFEQLIDKARNLSQKHHAFAQRTADDNSPRIASTLDFDSDKESITPSNTNAHNELYGANTSITSTAMQYRYIEHRNRQTKHRFVFNINQAYRSTSTAS
jgi:septal ring factor EnvC (AmiA/AmiB activator)